MEIISSRSRILIPYNYEYAFSFFRIYALKIWHRNVGAVRLIHFCIYYVLLCVLKRGLLYKTPLSGESLRLFPLPSSGKLGLSTIAEVFIDWSSGVFSRLVLFGECTCLTVFIKLSSDFLRLLSTASVREVMMSSSLRSVTAVCSAFSHLERSASVFSLYLWFCYYCEQY